MVSSAASDVYKRQGKRSRWRRTRTEEIVQRANRIGKPQLPIVVKVGGVSASHLPAEEEMKEGVQPIADIQHVIPISIAAKEEVAEVSLVLDSVREYEFLALGWNHADIHYLVIRQRRNGSGRDDPLLFLGNQRDL